MSNKFKFDEKKGELWLDEPQPKMEDFKMIDNYDNSVMIMGTVWEKAVENWKSRLHYPVSDELKKLLKDGQVIEMGIDFWIVEKCYKGTGFHDDWKEEAVPINDIALPLPEQTNKVKERLFTQDEVLIIMMDFARQYASIAAPQRDLANDAAEFLHDKFKNNKPNE